VQGEDGAGKQKRLPFVLFFFFKIYFKKKL